ncbi:hypothetical protein PG999_007458 [Apiospora kogelbergensis]|uniref:Uncharacterized protein n=1 Tax=Apiospora kogelbergensis TaxID=1337665 RepID=A0AAW0QYH6_9PEZI
MDGILQALAHVLDIDWNYRKHSDCDGDSDGVYRVLSTALKGLVHSRGQPPSFRIRRPLGEVFENQKEQPSGTTNATQPSFLHGRKHHSCITCLRGYHHFRLPSNKRTLKPKKPRKARDLDLAEDTVLLLLSTRRKRKRYCPRKNWENEDATDYSFVDVNMELCEKDEERDFHEVRCRLRDVGHQGLVAYESYIGAILGGQFQLGAIIQEEDDKRTYEVHPLVDSSWRLQATAFRLQGLPKKLLDSRKRQLRRLEPRSLCRIDQAGMKFVVHEARDLVARPGGVPLDAGDFVLDHGQYPSLASSNGPIAPVIAGVSWAVVARALAQDPQPSSNAAEPDQNSSSSSHYGNIPGDRVVPDKPCQPERQVQAGKRPRRKRRQGKAKSTSS